MDASAVLTLVQTFLQVLDSPISREIESVWGYQSQLQKLRDTMSFIKALFRDAENLEKRQLLTHTLRDKLERLQEAVYRADDLFDEVATVTQRKKLMSGNKVCREVRLFFTRFNQLCSAFKMSREIREVRQMLDDIKNDHDVIGSIPPSNLEVSYNPRETHSFVCEEDVIIGRAEDKRKVIAMLVDEAATVEEAVFIVSIVGIGGLGKTTLAQLVYNDDRIQSQFQLKMWVCVSEDFDVKLLLRQILAEATKKTTDSGLTKEQLQRNLRQNLEGKKYLLVLDDIWNEDPNKWLELRRLLVQGGRGSTIIVTTRSLIVARTVGSHQTHQLEGLSDQDSWNLFLRMTLEPGQDQLDAHLVEIGKVIVSKCVNVPLAIRVMGSLLRGQGESVWQNLMHTDLANVEQDENYGIMPVLKVSYDYLPSHLKSCFTYCAIYPKDYEIKKEDLICLWMAHGFIMPLSGRSFEDLGEYYFVNLLQRCFFQDVKRDSVSGVIVSCKMHDLVHDLAKGIAGKGIMSSSNDINSSDGSKTRHIFIDDTIVRTKDLERYITKLKRVHTCLGWQPKCICFYGLVPKMRYVRALGLRQTNKNMKKLSSMIGQLVHLRYLDLSNCRRLSMLPNSITQLFNLQTLKLLGCDRLKELPRELSKLVNLRHLDTRDCYWLRHMPPGMNRMTNLHKLTMFVVGGNNNGSCLSSGAVGKLGDLKYLNNLTGELQIRFKKGWTYEAAEVEEGGFLINKSLLDDILISFYVDDFDDIENAEALLQALQPHRNVKALRLRYYSGVKFPSWGSRDSLKMNLSSHFPNLVELGLKDCKRLKHVPLLSQLSHLKVLTLVNLRELEHVESSSRRGDRDGATTVSSVGTRQGSAHAESIFFPSLEKLVLEDLPELRGWWKASDSDLEEGEIDMMGNNYNEQLQQENEEEEEEESSIVAFPRLSELLIFECPNLVIIPWIPKVKRLRVHGSKKVMRYIDSLLPGESFQHLNHLVIRNDDEIERLTTMEMFRSGCLSSLRSLKFDECRKLESIGGGKGVWEQFTALEFLSLVDLDELEMEDSEGDDDDMPWRCLAPSLRHLILYEIPKMGKLPMGMRHLTALQRLSINWRMNLEEIPGWISCLTSLQELHIKRCPKVKSLPEEIRHLTSLNRLDLDGCSAELKERCQGADRHIIQHIPTIRYN